MVATDSRYLQLLRELRIHGERHQVRYGETGEHLTASEMRMKKRGARWGKQASR
jgi:hypothetical protein